MTFAELQALISRPRTLLGFAIAPLLPGTLWALPALAAGDPAFFFMIVLVSGFYGYLILAIVGVPAFILANALRWKGMLAYAAIGTFLPGAVVMLLLYRMTQGGPVPLPAIPFLFGTLPAVAFWLTARPDLPDRLVLNLRTVAGFAIAPWIPGFVVGLTYLARIDFTSAHKDKYNAAAFMDSISASGFAGYPLAILLGIPLYFLLGWLRGTGIVLYAVLGAVLAAAGWMIPPLARFLSGWTDALILPELHGSLLEQPPVAGIVTTVVFWFIVRPDRTGSLPATPAPASSECQGDERQGNERRGNDRPAGETQSRVRS
ncbi:hypothetical protein [Hypericibacter sp.]|uniref:hypothetical protein n=1 Tax=Hypericibacter sp. TaxID=2705401 RepID=UPI003D6D7E87